MIIKTYPPSSTTEFAESIIRNGISRLDQLGHHLGLPLNVNYLAAPDFSITLNQSRLDGGFTVGGILSWGDGTVPLIPLDTFPNCCGTIMASTREEIHADTLLSKLRKLLDTQFLINGLPCRWDILHKNHFFNIYKDQDGKPFIIIHCSMPEVKGNNPIGYGTYHTQCSRLRSIKKQFSSDYGLVNYVTGDEANEVYSQFQLYSQMAKEKRESMVSQLFDNHDVLFNMNHIDFIDMNTIALGCYASEKRIHDAPITIAPLHDAYIANSEEPYLLNGKQIHIVPHGSGNRIQSLVKISYNFKNKTFHTEDEGMCKTYTSILELFDGYNKPDVLFSENAKYMFTITKTISSWTEYSRTQQITNLEKKRG